MPRPLILFALCTISLFAHAPATPIPIPPLKVKANALTDSTGQPFLLRGVGLPDWETAPPFTYRIIQQRWNMNEVRFQADVAAWGREGQPYLDRLARAIAAANAEGLIVVLAAVGSESTGLPGAPTNDFWRSAATAFRSTPGLIFALYHEPVRKSGAGWREWRDAMQPLVATIRATGATQVIAAPSYQDALGFQGFTPEFYLSDPDILYEVHPYFDTADTDAARVANFGNLAGFFPVLAGAWGMPFGKAIPACTAIPRDLNKANELLFQSLAYFDSRGISWSAADFATASLLRPGDDYPATALDALWTCDAGSNPAIGIGQTVLLWMTGDPLGFGSLAASQIASAAGGFPGPIAPGEILSIYGQGIGPAQTVTASFDAAGSLPTALSDTQVTFNGIAAPIFFTGAFQVNVQVPWELARNGTVSLQLVYRGVPSNIVTLTLAPAAPDLFTVPGTVQAAVLDQDGSLNDAGSAAARGSIVSFFATGLGQSVPTSVTGARAPAPGGMAGSIGVRIAGVPAEILYAGPAPGLVGVTQINARVPAATPVSNAVERVSAIVFADGVDGRLGVTFWVK